MCVREREERKREIKGGKEGRRNEGEGGIEIKIEKREK